MDYKLVYITTSGVEEAEKIGRTLVTERLAACVNILAGMRSLYWWEGRVQDETEAVLLAKTTGERLEALTARVKSLHSYDCPCVVALGLAGGNQEFLAWIERETSPGARE